MSVFLTENETEGAVGSVVVALCFPDLGARWNTQDWVIGGQRITVAERYAPMKLLFHETWKHCSSGCHPDREFQIQDASRSPRVCFSLQNMTRQVNGDQLLPHAQCHDHGALNGIVSRVSIFRRINMYIPERSMVLERVLECVDHGPCADAGLVKGTQFTVFFFQFLRC